MFYAEAEDALKRTSYISIGHFRERIKNMHRCMISAVIQLELELKEF
jgi:hypothetical protein